MAPRPSSASIGSRPSWGVLNLRTPVGQYAGRYAAFCPPEGRSSRWKRPWLAENAQRHIEGDAEVGLVDDLTDPEVAGQAAEDVGILAAQRVVCRQPQDRVPDRIAGVLHQIWAQGADRVVALGVAARLKRGCRSDEVVAPRPKRGAFDHPKSEGDGHGAFEHRNA